MNSATELEFLKSLWGLGTEEEEGYRTGPPDYIGWRNLFLGIYSGAPYTFKNTGLGDHTQPVLRPQSTYRGREEKGECICPLKRTLKLCTWWLPEWKEVGVHPPPSLTGMIFLSWWNVATVAIATLCVLCGRDLTVHVYALYRLTPGTCLSKMSTIPTAEQRRAEAVRNVWGRVTCI